MINKPISQSLTKFGIFSLFVFMALMLFGFALPYIFPGARASVLIDSSLGRLTYMGFLLIVFFAVEKTLSYFGLPFRKDNRQEK